MKTRGGAAGRSPELEVNEARMAHQRRAHQGHTRGMPGHEKTGGGAAGRPLGDEVSQTRMAQGGRGVRRDRGGG